MEKTNKWLNLISGLLLVAIGIPFFLDRQKAFDRLGLLFGLVLIALGILQLVQSILAQRRGEPFVMKLLFGIVTVSFGILLTTNLSFVRVAILALFGIWALFIGIIRFIVAVQYHRDEVHFWYAPLVAGIVSIVFGIFALLGSQVAEVAVAIITGIYLTAYGLYSLSEFFLFEPFRKKHLQKEQ